MNNILRIKGSLVFRLWLPFVVLILLFSMAGAFYYSNKQRKVIRDKYLEALDKIGTTVTLGVEFSINYEDFNGLNRTLDFVRKDTTFDYILILTTDSLQNKQEELLAVFPNSLQVNPSLTNPELYLFRDFPYNTEAADGVVRVGVNTKRLQGELKKLNEPVLWALLLTFLIMTSIIFYIVQIVTRPILKLSQTIGKSSVSEMEMKELKKSTYGELRVLTESFHLLKINLLKEEQENNRILENLDHLVFERTEELHLARERLTKAQKTALLASFEYNTLTDEFSFCDSFEEIFMFPVAKNLSSFLALIEDERKTELTRLFFDDNTSNNFFDEDIKLKANGTTNNLWVQLICSKVINEHGDIIINGTIQNITKQKLAEEEIVRLSLVAELTSNSVVITDEKKTISWANRSFLALTGYELDEIIGQSPRMFQYEKTSSDTIKTINEKLANNEIVRNIEVQNRGKNGNEYWLELNIVPIQNNGATIGYIGVEVDITERKELETKLLTLNSDLEKKVIENTQKYLDLTQAYNEQEKLAAIGEVTAGIAHDLNTPISTIIIGAESLENLMSEILGQQINDLTPEEIKSAYQIATNTPLEIFISGSKFELEKRDVLNILASQTHVHPNDHPEIADLLVKCRLITEEKISMVTQMQNLKKLLQLIEKIETILRLTNTIKNSSGKSAAVIQNIREHIRKTENKVQASINLSQSITSALNIFNYSLDKKVQIETEISERIFIKGNEVLLFQLWSNLIKNAIEAMKDTAKPMLKISAVSEQGIVKIDFENNGPCIPEDALDSIFSRFYSTKSNLNGTGLGLTIVQNVIKEHDGSIHIKSDTASTVFTVTLNELSLT